jgi:hypothetical protein
VRNALRTYNERVRSIVHTLFLFFAHLGAFGLLILGVLDSSFLFLPLESGSVQNRKTCEMFGIHAAVLRSTMLSTKRASGCN